MLLQPEPEEDMPQRPEPKQDSSPRSSTQQEPPPNTSTQKPATANSSHEQGFLFFLLLLLYLVLFLQITETAKFDYKHDIPVQVKRHRYDWLTGENVTLNLLNEYHLTTVEWWGVS